MALIGQSTIVVVGMESTEKYFSHFEVECHTDTTGNNKVNGATSVGIWDDTNVKWVQRNPMYFRGLTRGTTYQFRARTIPQGGGAPSAWTGWSAEVAGDTVAPSATYTPTATRLERMIHLSLAPSGASSDIHHYEIRVKTSAGTPPDTNPSDFKDSPFGSAMFIFPAPDISNTTTTLYIWGRAVDTSGNRQSWQSIGTFITLPNDTYNFFELGISTRFSKNGTIVPITTVNNLYTSLTKQAVAGAGVIRFTWVAFDINLPDLSTISVPVSSSLSVPASPTLSQVAGGALGARTRWVRVAYVKEKMSYGMSAEASFAISANNLLKVTSPSALAGYEGYIVLVGSATGDVIPQQDPVTTLIAFGTDWTEPAGGFTATGTKLSDLGAVSQGAYVWNLGTVTRYFYPSWSVNDTLLVFEGGPLTTATAATLNYASRDNHIPCFTTAISATVPAVGGSGGGSGGGCFATGTKLIFAHGVDTIENAKVGMFVQSKDKVFRRIIAVHEHDYDGVMHIMDDGQLVTPTHLFIFGNMLKPACDLFSNTVHYKGKVWSLSIEGQTFLDNSYVLESGLTAHNSKPPPP